MRIAVTYENNEVFRHFGHTEAFKIYTVENNAIVSAEVLSTNGQGHGALSTWLLANRIDVVICGGIGPGAQNALRIAGIELCAGAQGDCDKAAADYLAGSLVNAGVTCDHHGADHDCHDHDCGSHSCGGHCH